MPTIGDWLERRPTPILWVRGDAGTGKTAAVETALGATTSPTLRLSCLAPDITQPGIADASPLTAKQLIALATDHIVILDALDALQDHTGSEPGRIADARLRQLLALASDVPTSNAAVIVTSRVAPPHDLRPEAMTVIELPAAVASAVPMTTAAPQDNGTRPEFLIELLLDGGQTSDAVMVYWRDLGNFPRLQSEGRLHFGARICWRLNGCSPPNDVSPLLKGSEGAWAVLNDWSQFAFCTGDADVSAQAAESAYHLLLSGDAAPWDAGRLAAQVAKALCLGGRLADAMRWCERSWEHARHGMRKTEGVAVQEIVEAYDWAGSVMAKVYLRLGDATELQRLADDLTAIHQHARDSIRELNQSALAPLPGPQGTVVAEELLDGQLVAALALAQCRFDDVRSLVEKYGRRDKVIELSALTLQAEIGAQRGAEAQTLLNWLRDRAEEDGDDGLECEMAIMATRIGTEDPVDRLRRLHAYVARAHACRLGSHWRDLQIARARTLLEAGRVEEGRAAAGAVLSGTRAIAGACGDHDWIVAAEAVQLLQSISAPIAADVLAALEERTVPARQSPAKPDKRRPSAAGGPATAEANRHRAALRVAEQYEKEGQPFVLYFRKFSLDILHGPSELGPKLTENALRDALPPGVEVLTIQDQRSTVGNLEHSRFNRESPSLLLDDEEWARVVDSLIPFADLIVSEPLFLSGGVRAELQMIHDAHRSDRTVLLLPPFESNIAAVDNDSLVRLFPRCIWADALHDTPLASSRMITDLLERVQKIAALPDDQRRALTSPAVRDEAYPVDLLGVAEHLEQEVEVASASGLVEAYDRYNAFWKMFRAATIRRERFLQGDKTPTNRRQLARCYLEMAKLMVDFSEKNDKIIFKGDPAESKLLGGTAYGLVRDLGDETPIALLRREVESHMATLERVEHTMRQQPGRYEIQHVFGPLMNPRSES